MEELIDIYLVMPWNNQDEWGLFSPHPSLCHGSSRLPLETTKAQERQGAAMLLRGGDPFWELGGADKKGEKYFISELPQTQARVIITLPLPLVHRKHAVSAVS